MAVGLTRFQARLFAHQRSERHELARRVVVIGAGDTGASLVGQMLTTPRGLKPVAILDDDTSLLGRRIHGVPVTGTTDDVLTTCGATGAHQVLVALPSSPRSLLRRIADDAEAAGAATRVFPRLGELVSGDVRLEDVRDLEIEDLLGREPVATDFQAVERLVSGRSVLVTGAGGSIGSEICRQVSQLGPARLLMLDHDETLLHDASADVTGPHELVLADLRDGARIRRLLDAERPDLVFHAAAHKHVPILEQHPAEAAATNVLGTQGLVEACLDAGVDRFIAISTDKAVRPSSVMGATKRIAEHVVTDAAQTSGRAYAAVRFGNVLGSRGSVVPTFIRQIERGGPVTVTSPRMTRYFMTIPEAVQLVLQAATLARGGEIFMLDMGEPVTIADLARRMVRLSGRRVGADVEILFTGPRPGEKLAEELSRPEEVASPTDHAAILRLTPVGPTSEGLSAGLAHVRRLVQAEDDAGLRTLLMAYAHHVHAWPEPGALPLDLAELAWNRSTT
jgi:FlaA1/EpsC-like NDP-sugar epimerase